MLSLDSSEPVGDPEKSVVFCHSCQESLSYPSRVGKCFNFTKDDSMLSILPMNHLFEITVGYMTFLNKGASIYYSNSLKPKDIFTVMQEKKITFMVGVPAFIKLVKSTIESEIRNYSKFKKLWFEIKYNFAKLANNHLVSKMLFD